MAPERAKGQVVDRRADIRTFGVVLYEMLVGGSLFAADSVAGVLKSQIESSRLAAETPAAIRRLLHRCLERNPRNRLHDIAGARIVLEEVIQGGGASAPAPGLAAAPDGRRFLVNQLVGEAANDRIDVLLGWTRPAETP